MSRVEVGRKAAIAMAGGRAVLGLSMAIAPRLAAVTWIGREGRKPGPQLLTRAMGGRDAALGIAAIAALARRSDARLWIGAQVAADITDLVATAVAVDDLPRTGRRGVLALAGAATAAGLGTMLAAGGGNGSGTPLTSDADVTVPAASTADGLDAVVIGGESQDDPSGG